MTPIFSLKASAFIFQSITLADFGGADRKLLAQSLQCIVLHCFITFINYCLIFIFCTICDFNILFGGLDLI